MATKKFSQMATKKLNALLETANNEDKVQIEAVLAAREATATTAIGEAPVAGTNGVTETIVSELTPDEEAALKAAEANNGVNPAYNGHNKSKKLTDDERRALAEKLKANINHKCQVVPFNTIEWTDGYIAGVTEEKRSNKVLYAIKLVDGRRIVKVHDSNFLRILDEVITPERKTRVPQAKAERVEWTPEALAEEINAIIDNVGKTVEFEKYRATTAEGDEKVELTTGRIMAIVPDKRVQTLLYRIAVPAPTEADPTATKIVHKVSTSTSLNIAPEFDAEGAALNAKYRERREAATTRVPLTPQDRVMKCEENLKKAQEKLTKAQEEFEAKIKQLEEAKIELEAYLKTQAGEASVDDNEPLD